MTTRTLGLSLLAATTIMVTVQAQVKKSTTGGFASRSTATAASGFDLRRLGPLVDGKLPADQAARLYLSLLHEEVSRPSPPRRGVAGPINHGYIVSQIVLAGKNAEVDRAVLQQAASKAGPGEYTDAIALTLGLLGDRRMVPFLIGYLQNPQHSPFLREMAARALGENPDARSVAVLAAALHDPFWLPSHGVGGSEKAYEIRFAARAALRKIQKAGVALPGEVETALENARVSEPLTQSADR